MGAELVAVRDAIYNRLSADGTMIGFVGSNFYTDIAPPGSTGPSCIYRERKVGPGGTRLDKGHVAVLGATPVMEVFCRKVTARWSDVTVMGDRIYNLLAGFSVTVGGYDVYFVPLEIYERREYLPSHQWLMESGYTFMALASATGVGYAPAARAYLAFGPSGSEVVLSLAALHIELAGIWGVHPATRVDMVTAQPAPVALDYAFDVLLAYTPALDAALYSQLKLTKRSVIWGPGSNASGARKYSSTGAYLSRWQHRAGESGQTLIEARIQVVGDLTQGSF